MGAIRGSVAMTGSGRGKVINVNIILGIQHRVVLSTTKFL